MFDDFDMNIQCEELEDYFNYNDILEDLQCSSDLRGSTAEVDPSEIDFGSAFCCGEKNRAFYSIITAEELNTLYEN